MRDRPLPNAAMRVACLGDSITKGDNTTHTYTELLQKRLLASWPRAEVLNFGVNRAVASAVCPPGPWPCFPYASTASLPAALAATPTVVVIMLGTNDYLLGTARLLEKGLQALVEQFLRLTQQPRILLATPPPLLWASEAQANRSSGSIRALSLMMPAQIWCIAEQARRAGLGLSPPLDTYHAFLPPRAAKGAGGALVDAYGHERGSVPGCASARAGTRCSLFQDDGVHPNGKGNALIAERVARAIREPPSWAPQWAGEEQAHACCLLRNNRAKFAHCAQSQVLPALLAESNHREGEGFHILV